MLFLEAQQVDINVAMLLQGHQMRKEEGPTVCSIFVNIRCAPSTTNSAQKNAGRRREKCGDAGGSSS